MNWQFGVLLGLVPSLELFLSEPVYSFWDYYQHSGSQISIRQLAKVKYNKARQQGRFAPGPLNSGPCLKR